MCSRRTELQAETASKARKSVYILNIVKHIQDYYASVLGEFEQVCTR